MACEAEPALGDRYTAFREVGDQLRVRQGCVALAIFERVAGNAPGVADDVVVSRRWNPYVDAHQRVGVVADEVRRRCCRCARVISSPSARSADEHVVQRSSG